MNGANLALPVNTNIQPTCLQCVSSTMQVSTMVIWSFSRGRLLAGNIPQPAIGTLHNGVVLLNSDAVEAGVSGTLLITECTSTTTPMFTIDQDLTLYSTGEQ